MAKNLRYLPELYSQEKDFTALRSLFSVDNLIDYFDKEGQIHILRKNIRLLARVSFENDEWQYLVCSALLDSIFTDIKASPPLLSAYSGTKNI